MANYMLSVVYPEGRTKPEPEQLAKIGAAVTAVHEEMEQAGAWVFGGGLAPTSSATVVEARDTDPLITDGPFAEGKEYLGGLSIIDVPDLDAALGWAEKLSRATTVPIEIRPFVS
ncbi:YciI family protein [Virgisporangium aurantiacum]|uniref:YCII-related domain-containing protein n=1 Tax=Virgisporangium aurantiacum TaxID=175570 RepID=A0A8J3Z616_9ACTN|nr:YciI family protein [Virgisporangium aurantiacum]GIJ55911.1 hypothetical protein Vau01_034270 [Virgisporangium aurantiacum]